MVASNEWMCISWTRTVLNTPPSQKNPKQHNQPRVCHNLQHSTSHHPHSAAWAPRRGILPDPFHNLQLTAPKSHRCRDAVVTLAPSSHIYGGITSPFCVPPCLFNIVKCSLQLLQSPVPGTMGLRDLSMAQPQYRL